MKSIINKLIKDWAWRVNDGCPDPNKSGHLELLEATLRSYKYPESFIKEYLLQIEATCKRGQNPGRDGCVAADGSKGTGKKAKEEPAKSEKPKPIKNTKFPKKASGPEWDGKNTDEIIDSVSTKTDPPVKEVKSPKEAKQRQDKHREAVFQGKKTGKGGGETTVQEEITNIGRQIAIDNPDIANMSKEEQVDAIMEEIKKIPGYDEKWDEDDLRTLAEKSTAGINTAKTIESNKERYNYAEEQPEGYPVNTTDGVIVRDVLATQLKEAEESGDEEAIKQAKKELYDFQRRAGDKSITGKEGDADTMMVYKDDQGRDRVIYITNKQTLNDQMSSSTVGGTKRSIIESDVKMTPEQKETVLKIAEDQHSKATKFDEHYAKDTKKTYEENKEVMTTPQAKSTTSKLASGVTKRSIFGKKESELTEEELQEKKHHVNNLKKKPEVQAKLMGIDGPPNNDTKSKEYKEWKKKTKAKWEESDQNHSEEDIVNAGMEAMSTGGMSNGSHNRTIEKVLIGVKDIRAEVKKRMDKGMSQEEAIADTQKSLEKGRKDKKGNMEYKYGGKLDENDIKEIVQNEGYTAMIEDEKNKKNAITNMQLETTQRLLDEDKKNGYNPPETPTGPHTQTYTDGFLNRIHVKEDVLGNNDNNGFMEAGEHSITPQEKRSAYAKEFGYQSEDEFNKKHPDGKDENGKSYGEGLYQHILDNTYPKGKEGKQKIYYVSKTTGKEVEIGTDTHRTAGPSSKVAGQHSPHMQNKFIEADKE